MSSLEGTSGLVGGEDAAVEGLLSESSSVLVADLEDDWFELLVDGRGRSGALYESMLVVWISSIGPEI